MLIGNFFVWLLFYLFSDKIRVYHPELSPVKHFRASFRQLQYYGYGIFKGDPNPHHLSAYHKFNALQSMAYQIIMLLLVPLQFVTGLLLWDLKRFAGAVDFFGGVRVVDTVHVLLFIFFTAFILVHPYLASLGHTPLGALQGDGHRLRGRRDAGRRGAAAGRLILLRVAEVDVVLLHQRLEVGALHAGVLGAARDVPGVAAQRLEHELLLDRLRPISRAPPSSPA